MAVRLWKSWLILLLGTICGVPLPWSLGLAADPEGDMAVVDPDHAARRTKGLALFKSDVRSILSQHCVGCHGEQEMAGRLDLATQEGLFTGGERGPAAVVGRGDRSLLIRLAAHQQEPHMPKDAERLTDHQLALLTEWIDLGAPYDEPLVARGAAETDWTERKVAADARTFWSFQRLQTCLPPDVQDQRGWVSSPIDRFILARLNRLGLEPNDTVSRLALLRRVAFDLVGLPPSLDDIQEFLADTRPDAYERLIDRLLANPHYGERWGRRWLDLARFAESHGFEHDYDRATAFHYRDFVVQALNAGMPYDQFVRWQIAGDEVAPDDRLAMMATGYLAAGVHSTQITKNEVEKHRYDEMDDMLGTIGTSLLGLTIGCARCHDHKFDAIPQADYYRLLSTFTSTIRSEVELDFDPEGYQRAKSAFDREHVPYVQAVDDYTTHVLPERYREWQGAGGHSVRETAWLVPTGIQFRSQGNATFTPLPDASWLQSGTSPEQDVWTITFDTRLTGIRSIRLEALADASLVQSGPGRGPNGNFALSDFRISVEPLNTPAGTKPAAQTVQFVGAKATFEQNGLPVAAAIDENPGSAWAVDPEFGKDHAAVFELAEPFGDASGTRVTITCQFKVNVHHSIGRPRISISQKQDLPATTGVGIDELTQSLIDRPWDQLSSDQQQHVLNWYKVRDPGWKSVEERRVAHAALGPRPRLQKVLVATEGLPAVTLHTQAEAEFLKATHFLRRGETAHKDAIATQSFLQVLMADPATPETFQVPPPSGWRTSYSRRSLTNWLLDREQGAGNLLARVISNRLWQHHLGRGIVATPSDFGTRGDRPTHPELLDWLSQELVHHNWELKPLHRQILTSSVYQQSCDMDEARAELDRENSGFWHRGRRRLEAEVIRDAILAVSHLLDDRLSGPGSLDEGHRRRSLYFTIKRSQLMPSMTVFDAPDGTTPVADRPETTVAPQALLLMNHGLIREAAHRFAQRLMSEEDRTLEQMVERGYLIAICRPPDAQERVTSVDFIQQQAQTYANGTDAGIQQGMEDFCQVLFCLNEFIYLD